MATNDPIADMLTRMRNAVMAGHESVVVPQSKVTLAIAGILKEEGYVKDYEVLRGDYQRMLKINLRYSENKAPVLTQLKRVSKPGLRVYAPYKDLPKFAPRPNIAIVSTSQGVMTAETARRQHLGGEVLCIVG